MKRLLNPLVYVRRQDGRKVGRPLGFVERVVEDEHGLHAEIRLTPHGRRLLADSDLRVSLHYAKKL